MGSVTNCESVTAQAGISSRARREIARQTLRLQAQRDKDVPQAFEIERAEIVGREVDREVGPISAEVRDQRVAIKAGDEGDQLFYLIRLQHIGQSFTKPFREALSLYKYRAESLSSLCGLWATCSIVGLKLGNL